MLGFVICGVEHSGTTLVSDLFRQVPGIDAGFELGVLLADSPRRFETVETHYQYLAPGWGLSPDDLTYVRDTDDFAEFYRRLLARAHYLRPGTARLFDKTPRYLAHLDTCLTRTDAPFIVTYKDPRAIAHSDWLRAGKPDFAPWFEAYAPAKLAYLESLYAQYRQHQGAPRVLSMALETICLAAGRSCEAIFAHASERFDTAYLALRDKRFHNTHGTSIEVGIPFGYRRDFDQDARRHIEQVFASLDNWFWA